MTTVDLEALAEQLGVPLDGMVHGCGCGVVHRYEPSAVTADPYKWRTIRANILERDGRRCQVPVPGSGVQAANPVARLNGVEVCGRPATIAGHKLARARGGCDRPRNLQAECKPHSDADSGRLTRDERDALNLARALVARGTPLTDGDGSVFSEGVADVDVGSSRVDLQACKLEYSIVSPK